MNQQIGFRVDDNIIPNLHAMGYYDINFVKKITRNSIRYSVKNQQFVVNMYKRIKLTNEDVVNIHIDHLFGMTNVKIAKKYNIKHTEVKFIIENYTDSLFYGPRAFDWTDEEMDSWIVNKEQIFN